VKSAVSPPADDMWGISGLTAAGGGDECVYGNDDDDDDVVRGLVIDESATEEDQSEVADSVSIEEYSTQPASVNDVDDGTTDGMEPQLWTVTHHPSYSPLMSGNSLTL